MSKQGRIRFPLGFVVGAAFIGLWQVCADSGIVSPVYLPGPDRAWQALVTGFTSSDLAHDTLNTITHMLFGWLFASLAGVALGALIGSSPRVRAYLNLLLEFFRPLPASAIFPLAIAFFGLSDRMVLIVIAFGALWPTLLATVHGFASVEPNLHEVSRLLGMKRWSVIMKISLPNALPDIFSGMRVSATVALVLSVVGEILASVDGLGLWVLLSARGFHSADLFAGVMLLGAIGYASSQMIALAERRLLSWQTI